MGQSAAHSRQHRAQGWGLDRVGTGYQSIAGHTHAPARYACCCLNHTLSLIESGALCEAQVYCISLYEMRYVPVLQGASHFLNLASVADQLSRI